MFSACSLTVENYDGSADAYYEKHLRKENCPTVRDETVYLYTCMIHEILDGTVAYIRIIGATTDGLYFAYMYSCSN